jgi:xanthine dehydrogenase accessory factor
VGTKVLVLESGERLGDGLEEAVAQFDELIRRGRNRLLTLDDGTKVFAEWYGPPPRLFVYGAVDTAEAMCRGAKLLGWHVIVADARGKFATPERIPSADELIVEWPEQAFAQVQPDHQTAIVVLTHDDKFDEPALIGALRTEAFYIGALGSRRNQERRRERLLEAGVAEEDIERIMGPCGLDVGADTQEETALSILAEILAVRAQREGGFLKDAKKRIHVEVE